jgi:TetR/AcrR family transcriptional regulator
VALSAYITRKLDYSRSHPTASRLFAMEMLQGAPHLNAALTGNLHYLVEVKSRIIESWIREGRIRPVDPKHLIFAIWATTQHYADFSTQIRSLTGKGIEDEDFYETARNMLTSILLDGVLPCGEGRQDVCGRHTGKVLRVRFDRETAPEIRRRRHGHSAGSSGSRGFFNAA